MDDEEGLSAGMAPLGIEGAWLFTPTIHRDDRGEFLEWFQDDAFAAGPGHPLGLAQANCSVSRRGVLRGIHFADSPPGQAKYVMCAAGAILDVVVDVRVGSPTFGAWRAVRLDAQSHQAVYLAEGLGHAFLALTGSATVVYLCSQRYVAAAERAIDPRDPDIGIVWPHDVEISLSAKDLAAPSLAEAAALRMLPEYAACRDYTADLAASRP
jgi:dTDP-4-dehydrorhamnose 3,5-epimerase